MNTKKILFKNFLKAIPLLLVLMGGLFFVNQVQAKDIIFDGNINLQGEYKIINITSNTTNPSDVATIDYVDSAFGALTGGGESAIWSCLTMEGDVCVAGNNTIYPNDGENWKVSLGYNPSSNPAAVLDVEGNVEVGGTITVNDFICSDCLGLDQISDVYVLNTSDTMTGYLGFSDKGSGSNQLIRMGGNQLGGIYQISDRGGLMLTSADDTLILANGDTGRYFGGNINPDGENTYVLSDGNFYVKTDLQEGWGTENTLVFNNAGALTVNGNTVWHAGNDGGGTGLHADLLDDQHGSYYLDTSPAAQVKSGDLRADNFLVDTSTVLNDAALTVNDVNRYVWTPANGWGVYWNTSDNTIEYYGSGTERGYLDLDNGNLQMDGSLTANSLAVNGAITGATLDTGQGANELYDMNQNVLTTSSPDFAGLDIVDGNINVSASSFSSSSQGVVIAKSFIPLSQFREVAQGASVSITGGVLQNSGPTARNGIGRWDITSFPQSITLHMPGSWWTRGISFTSAYIAESSYPDKKLPASFLVERSTNGVDWVEVADVTNNTSWYFYSNNITDAPYIKITARVAQSGQTTSSIANIQVFDAYATGTGQPFSVSGEGDAIFIGGDVGINDTSPSYKLDVNGDGRFTGNVTVATPTAAGHATTKEYVDGLGGGDVYGPGSSTDNAVARFNGPTGKLIQNSGIAIDDSNNLTTNGYLRGDGIYVGDDEYFWSDSEDRIATTDDFYVQAASSNTFLYSTNTYLGASSGDNIYVRGNTISGTSWSIPASGAATFGQPITVGSPSAASHAATKGYVDGAIVPADGYIGDTQEHIAGGNLIMRNVYLNVDRYQGADSGIQWYNGSYNAWAEYMAPSGTGQGPKGNLTAPSGSLVSGWALRSFIENASGYGWTFESGTSSDTTPDIVAEIRSSDGSMKIGGNFDVAGGEITSANKIESDNDATFPYIYLDSTGGGDEWTSQGVHISIGESGDLGAASLHMTYVGNGYGYIGSGAVSSGIPGSSYFRFDYDSSNIYSPDVLTLGNDLFVNDFARIDALRVGNASTDPGDKNIYVEGDATVIGKLTAGEIDPPYSIDGIIYATYGHSTTGLKEETVGKVLLSKIQDTRYNNQTNSKYQIPNSQIYIAEIDFDNVKKGSDLWLFNEVSAFGEDWNDLVVNLTPEGKADVWYEFIPGENKLIIYGNQPVKVSYRLMAPRFDWPERDTNLYNQTGEAPEGVGIFVR
ncbi:hypothetical protein K9K85_01735 [Patescibacteria group bacterium]|nr:hypothetical protein [Patescibacteria group bacterium]